MIAVLLLTAFAPLQAPSDGAPPEGLWLSAGIEAGTVGGDVVVGPTFGIGVESRPFSAHLRLPVPLRVFDLPPPRDPALPAACDVVRCEELTEGGRLQLESLSRVLDDVRVFSPRDFLHLRAGRLLTTLGTGVLVDRHTTASEWDRRKSGVYGELNLPLGGARTEAYAGHVLAPQDLFALRQSFQPMAGVVVGGSVAGDAFAPVSGSGVDRTGAVIPGAATRPVVAAALDAEVVLVDAFGLRLMPTADVSVLSGLITTGSPAPTVGAGAGIGAAALWDLRILLLEARGLLRGSSAGHRSGLFSTLYDVERRRALVGGRPGEPLSAIPADGGFGGDARVGLSLLGAFHLLSRLHLEPAAGGNALEVGARLSLGPFQGAFSALRRGFVDGPGVLSADLDAVPLICVAEGSLRFFGPFSFAARYVRLPRFDGQGGVRIDNDILVGVFADVVLRPG